MHTLFERIIHLISSCDVMMSVAAEFTSLTLRRASSTASSSSNQQWASSARRPCKRPESRPTSSSRLSCRTSRHSTRAEPPWPTSSTLSSRPSPARMDPPRRIPKTLGSGCARSSTAEVYYNSTYDIVYHVTKVSRLFVEYFQKIEFFVGKIQTLESPRIGLLTSFSRAYFNSNVFEEFYPYSTKRFGNLLSKPKKRYNLSCQIC